MKTNAARFAAGLALMSVGAPAPASGQYFPPPLIMVPPPAQDYSAPKPVPRSGQPSERQRPPADTPPQTRRGHYEGRTYVPD